MTSKKPVIAITVPLHKEGLSAFCSSLMVRRYGGIPVTVSEVKDYKSLHFDGLIISGGTDIFPDRYGGNIKENYIYDHARDEMELYLLKKAEDHNRPVLGICRGAQLINIHRGGSLHFDVAQAYEMAEYPTSLLANIFYRKRMHIENKDSLIFKALGCSNCRVNSIHRQAIDELGQGLTITAQEKNGVTQVVEDYDRHYYMGVQFHPEYLIYQRRFRRIFKKLVFSARNM